MDLVEERSTLIRWAEAKDDGQLGAYRAKKNVTSVDGLPSLGQGEGARQASPG